MADGAPVTGLAAQYSLHRAVEQPPQAADTLRCSGLDLLQKYGQWEDGPPVQVLAWGEELHGSSTTWPGTPWPTDWDGALLGIVCLYVLPVLGYEPGTVRVTERMNHQPVRVQEIGGVDVSRYWNADREPPAPIAGRFARYVDVAKADVLYAIQATGGWTY